MIDIGVRRLGRNTNGSILGAAHMENRRRGKPSGDAEHTPEGGVFGEILFGNFILPFFSLTVDQWDTVLFGIGMNPSTKPTRKPHEMGIVKIIIRPCQLSPLGPKSTARLGQIKMGIKNDTIYAKVCTIKVILIVFAQLIRHPHLSLSHHACGSGRQDTKKSA